MLGGWGGAVGLHAMGVLWWTKWQWDRFFCYLIFRCRYASINAACPVSFVCCCFQKKKRGQIWECSSKSSTFLEIGSIGVNNVLPECFMLG
jgi:hypothetical protein